MATIACVVGRENVSVLVLPRELQPRLCQGEIYNTSSLCTPSNSSEFKVWAMQSTIPRDQNEQSWEVSQVEHNYC